MDLPFTLSEFLDVFAACNEAVWPLQIVAVGAGAFAAGLLFYRPDWADRAISAVLAAFWFTMAVGYHWTFFAPINSAAYLFGGAFLLQSGLFLVEGVARNRIHYDDVSGIRRWIAGALIIYGMGVYPLIGLLLTHPYPATPLFGVAPCPTTLFTIGLLVLARYPRTWLLAVVPLAWCLVGGSAAIVLGVPADWALFAAFLAWFTVKAREAAA